MKRSLKKFFGTLLTSIAMVGVFVGFAPALSVSAASTISFSGISIDSEKTGMSEYPYCMTENTGNDHHAHYIRGYVKGLSGHDVKIYVKDAGASTKWERIDGKKYLNQTGTIFINCQVNSRNIKSNGAATAFSGKYAVKITVEKYGNEIPGAKYNTAFIVVKQKALNFMDILNPKTINPVKNYYLGALDLSLGKSAREVVSKYYCPTESVNFYYVMELYVRVLQRKAYTKPEIDYWTNLLNTGKKTKREVLEDFYWSQEFANLCQKPIYGFKL